jgi:Uma2 family endonuclease
MAVQFLQPHRFTAEQYRRMAEIGMVPENGTELIDGVVVSGTRPIRFTSEDYFRLGSEGILDEDDRVELVDGEIVDMSPIGPRHSKCVARLLKLLRAPLGNAELRVQDVLRVNEELTYHPDVAVYRLRPGEYEDEQPGATDALLVAEVADSSLLYDRTVKMEHYAEAGVREYWVVDLKRDMVIVARNPVASQYTDVREYRRGDTWRTPEVLAGEIRGEDVLGPARG